MMSGRSRLSAYENVVNQKPGPELLGDRRAADEMASLEDERPQPGLGQVGAVGQAVVAAADDDRVVASGRRRDRPSAVAGGRLSRASRAAVVAARRGLRRTPGGSGPRGAAVLVFGMSGGPSLGVEQRWSGDVARRSTRSGG